MPNFFHHPNITSEAAKECSQKISDYHERKNDDIEKIKFDPVKGMNIYSARLNKKRRCIYATSDHNDYVFILYLAEDHDYKKALRKVDGLNASSLTGFRLLNNERCCLGIFPKTDNKLELSKKTFVFDEIQSSALSDDPSNTYLISGPPGSGKTLVMYARLLKEEPETKVLYLASSPHLVRATHLAYNQDSPDNASVEFQTWDELLKPFFNKKDISSNEFEQWYSKNSGKLGKKYSSKVIHDEIGLYAALKKDKYEQLGKLGSALLEEERSTLMRLYEGWQQHLGERVDLAINHFESLREELSKYQSIYIDEAQNFSPMGLRQLMEFSPSDCSVTVALDPYQNLESSPYIVPCLNQLLNQYRQNGLKETALLDVKRSPKEVMAVARHVMKEANNYFDFSPKSLLQINGSNAHKSFADEAKAENDEIIYWIEEKTKRVNDVYGKSHSQSDPTEPTLKNARSRYGDTPKTVVIAFKVLQEEEKQRINSCFGTSYILSPEEAIGLEYDTVILWHPLTDCPPNLKNKLSKGAQSADRNEMMEYRPVFNALFVALTRACRRVILYDNLSTKVHEDLSSLLFPEVVKKIKAPEVSSSSAPDVVPVEKASDSEWIKRALAHLQRGKEEVAKSILVGQLKWSMEKFAQWAKTEEDKIHKPLKKKIQLNVHSAEQPANNGGQLTSDAGQPAKKKKKKKGSIVDNDAVANSMSAQLSASSSNVQMAKKQGQKGHRPAAPYSFKECVHKSKTSVQIVAGNPDGDTILHSAAGMGYPGVFSKLINKEGAKIDIKNNSGKTALHVATIHGHKTIVRLLIEKGAQVDIQDSNGATALHYATTNGYINIASLLIKKGAQIDIPENEGFTALHYAALKGLTGIVRALIKKEAQIGINNLGCTALHYAAYLGHTDIAHELINAGAKKDIKNCEGKTALQCATEKGYREIVNLLGGADQQSVSKKKKKKKKKKNKNKASSATPVASGAKVVPDEAAAEEVKTSLFAASAANFPENSGQTNNPHAFFQQHQHSDDNQQAMQFCFDEKFNDDSQQGMQH